MPFPLAHPAAVLPLRRYCPRWLSFPALIIGSLSPDVGYLFERQGWDALSHGVLGSVVFCLPVGIVLAALFYGLRSPIVKLLPGPYRGALLPLCQRGPGSIWGVVISVLIGVWTHLLWDSFTHNNGWCVQNLSFLQSVVVSVGGRTARVCHLLWYGFSFAGVIWLFIAFEKWKQAAICGGTGVSTRAMMRDGVLVAVLVLPIALVRHLLHGQHFGFYVVAGLCALPVFGIALKLGTFRKNTAGERQRHDRRG